MRKLAVVLFIFTAMTSAQAKIVTKPVAYEHAGTKLEGGAFAPFTLVPPLWMAGNQGCMFCGKPSFGLVSASSRPSSSLERVMFSACTLSSN